MVPLMGVELATLQSKFNTLLALSHCATHCLWKVSLKILNSGIILKILIHVNIVKQ